MQLEHNVKQITNRFYLGEYLKKKSTIYFPFGMNAFYKIDSATKTLVLINYIYFVH